jgi:hypothetical protein
MESSTTERASANICPVVQGEEETAVEPKLPAAAGMEDWLVREET